MRPEFSRMRFTLISLTYSLEILGPDGHVAVDVLAQRGVFTNTA